MTRLGQLPQVGFAFGGSSLLEGLLPPSSRSTAPAEAEPTDAAVIGLAPLAAAHATSPDRVLTAVDAADAARHGDRVDASLQRTAEALEATRRADGRWDTLYAGGNMQMAITAIALADLNVDASRAKDAEVFEHFARGQLSDGGFPTVPGEASDPATTRLVALAASMMARRDPSFAARAAAIVAGCERFLATNPTRASNGMYPLTANLLSDVLRDDTNLLADVPLGAMLTSLTDAAVGDRMAHLARVFVPAFGILMENQAQKTGWVAWAMGGLSDSTRSAYERELIRSQDGDGAWGWTGFGTALAVMALKRQGHTVENSPSLRRGVEFLTRLRAQDISAWTHADAWDTAYATLTLQTIDPKVDVTKGMDELLHGQLANGLFSFSVQGALGDADTTSVALRSMSARYAVEENAAERQRLGAAIQHAVKGLLEYQRSEGGWGSSNKRTLPMLSTVAPPRSPSVSALNDVQSPDLTGRVISALIDAERSGALSRDMSAKASKAVVKGAAYLRAVRNQDGSWWSRWTCGPMAGFAYVVPALRRAGEPARSPAFDKLRPLILSQQNADGGWGDEIASDRNPSAVTIRGRSSIAHTASAMIGLIGSADKDDAELRDALHQAAEYLLRNENAGHYSNGRPLYTTLTGLDYYDSDNWTTSVAAAALQLYRDYLREGPDAAMRKFRL